MNKKEIKGIYNCYITIYIEQIKCIDRGHDTPTNVTFEGHDIAPFATHN